jgi:hypothetical protein
MGKNRPHATKRNRRSLRVKLLSKKGFEVDFLSQLFPIIESNAIMRSETTRP